MHGLARGATISVAGLLASVCLPTYALATDISGGNSVNASTLATGDAIDFKGGTLKLDTTGKTLANNMTIENLASGTNTIDTDGNSNTLSGILQGAGALTITNSGSGGSVTFTGLSTLTGAITVNTGTTVAIAGTGSLGTAGSLTDNGTLDISATTSGTSLVSLSGAGNVLLGSQTLTLSTASGAFSGVISGSGSLILNGGSEVLTGANTYTGGTTINSGTLQIGSGSTVGSILGNVTGGGTLAFDRSDNISFIGVMSGTGGISQVGTGTLTITAANTFSGNTTISGGTLTLSSTGSMVNANVADSGVFDISATSGTSIRSLTGAGTVQLGSQTLVISNGSGIFSGVVAGSGNIEISGGAEGLSGANTYTGTTTVDIHGTLALEGTSFSNDVTNNGLVAFDAPSVITMNGIISGTGAVEQLNGTATITSVQTYSGTTTISSGTLALSGSGSISNSSSVIDDGTFSIASAAATDSIKSLAGTGNVDLGAHTLILTGAADSFSGVISGSGGITLTGGSETLSGGNLFTGPTTISSGTLVVGTSSSLATSSVTDNATLDITQASAAGASTTVSVVSLAGSGHVVLGTNTLALSGADGTFSGVISGSGGLTVLTGTEILTGANTYSGTTTVQNGTLRLTGAGSLSGSSTVSDSGVFDISGITAANLTLASLSGTGTVTLGAKTLTLANANTVFFGAISGTGGVAVTGGTQILAGTNTYTGGTTITAGTLQIGNGGVLGSIVGNVADNGTLSFDNTSGTGTLAGVVSGNGNLVQAGAGTTILTGANTYNGGTTISAGTLQLGAGGTTGSITGDVTDNGTLAFDRSDATSFAGAISGTGGVHVMTGDLTLTGTESYSGTTVIDTGANLTLTGTSNIASSSGVTDNGTLDLSGTSAAPQLASLAGSGALNEGAHTLTITNGDGDFSGVISGTAGLSLTGGTDQILSGVSTYSGATTVTGGELTVNGSIASSSGVTVGTGGTIAGDGTLPVVVLGSGGSIAPGSNGTGTLKAPSVTFNANSNFVVDIVNSSAGTLSTTSNEALAGNLTVVSEDGTFPVGQKLTVLTTTGTVSGSFTNTATLFTAASGAKYSTAVSSDTHDVFVSINLAKLSNALPTGSTLSEQGAAGGIDKAIALGDTLPAAFQNLGTLPPATLQNDAGQLAGEVAADVSSAGQSLSTPFLNAMADHLADEQPNGMPRSHIPQRTGVWAAGLIGHDIRMADGGSLDTHQLKTNTDGFIAGGDWNLEPNLLFGVAASVGSADFHLTGDTGKGKVDGYQLGVYGLAQFSRHLYGSLTASFGLDDVTTSRAITVSGTDTLQGKVSGRSLAARYETGAALGWITPYIAIQDTLFDAPTYKETALSGAATFALNHPGTTTNASDTEVGFRQRIDVPSGDWMFKISDRFAWEHDMSGTPDTNAAFAALQGSDFTTYGTKTGRNALLFSLGAGLATRDGFGIDFHFNSAFTSTSQSYSELVDLKYAW
jgi:autotransporter-associated beta strand protein